MSTANTQDPRPGDVSGIQSTFKARFLIRKPTIAQSAALCVLLVLAGGVGYILHPTAHPTSQDSQLPSFVPLPMHASLVRFETFLKEHIQNWYYTIPQLSEDEGLTFFQTQLPQHGWQCVNWTTNTNMSFYGQALSGTSIYLTALRGNSKAQVYLGDQEYAAWLIQDDVPEGAIALKISLEPAENAPCIPGT